MVRINDRYVVLVDADNYILAEAKTRGDKSKEAGEVYYDNIGYYTKLYSAVEAGVHLIVKNKLMDNDYSLPDAAKAIRDTFDEFLAELKSALNDT